MNEFEFIHKKLLPLTLGAKEALSLQDDAALISQHEGEELIVSTDTAVEGVHFRASYPPRLIAKKILRSSLSDVAAMGAEPVGVFFNLLKAKNLTSEWLDFFIQGLQEDIVFYNCPALGGDTVAINGPMSLSVTVLGRVPQGKALRRSTAQEGDLLVVTGTIGDSYLGLQSTEGQPSDFWDHCVQLPFVIQRHLLPEPRIAAGILLRDFATATIDISDGLLGDLSHMARFSNLTAKIDLEKVPLSGAGKEFVGISLSLEKLQALASGGEDYELAFSVAPEKLPLAQQALQTIGLTGTVIGSMIPRSERGSERGSDLDVRFCGAGIECIKKGYTHF